MTSAWGLPWLVPDAGGDVIVVGVIVAYIAVSSMFLIWWERDQRRHPGPLRPHAVGRHGGAAEHRDGIKSLSRKTSSSRPRRQAGLRAGAHGRVRGLAGDVRDDSWAPGLIAKDLNIGLLDMVAISSLTVVGIIMVGWTSTTSTRRWAMAPLRGGQLRGAAGLSSLGPVTLTGTMSMGELVEAQGERGRLSTALVRVSEAGAFVAYLICALVSDPRPSTSGSESELVAGFHVEYSGMRFAIFFLAGYAIGRRGGHRDHPVPGRVARSLPILVFRRRFPTVFSALVWFQVKVYF